MCIFASALYIKLGKQLILLYFKTMQNSDFQERAARGHEVNFLMKPLALNRINGAGFVTVRL